MGLVCNTVDYVTAVNSIYHAPAEGVSAFTAVVLVARRHAVSIESLRTRINPSVSCIFLVYCAALQKKLFFELCLLFRE